MNQLSLQIMTNPSLLFENQLLYTFLHVVNIIIYN